MYTGAWKVPCTRIVLQHNFLRASKAGIESLWRGSQMSAHREQELERVVDVGKVISKRGLSTKGAVWRYLHFGWHQYWSWQFLWRWLFYWSSLNNICQNAPKKAASSGWGQKQRCFHHTTPKKMQSMQSLLQCNAFCSKQIQVKLKTSQDQCSAADSPLLRPGRGSTYAQWGSGLAICCGKPWPNKLPIFNTYQCWMGDCRQGRKYHSSDFFFFFVLTLNPLRFHTTYSKEHSFCQLE